MLFILRQILVKSSVFTNGLTFRQYLRGRSYDEQHTLGVWALKHLNIIDRLRHRQTRDKTVDNGSLAVTYAVLEFADAARSWGVATFAYDIRGQEKALERCIIAELKIHDLTGSVDVVLPLLQHEDPAVQRCAAIPLLSDHRDKAVAALRILDETAELEISFGAGAQLEMMGEPNRATGPDGPIGREKVPTLAERYAVLQDQVRKSRTKT